MSYISTTSPAPGLPMPPLSAMDKLKDEYDRMRKAEDQRHVFVENLMAQVTTLMQEKDDVIRKLQRVEVSCDHYQKSLDEAQKSAESLQKTIDCARFVLVLIDGDVTLFTDDYVTAGVSGGERAASDLNNTIFNYLKSTSYFQHDFKIQIRIYMNLHDLAETFHEAGVTTSEDDFYKFVKGFNKTHELLEIIDAGDLKEAADTKIKATFNLYRRNLHCKHIMFAGSGDSSYAGFLRQFESNDPGSLTLIKGVEFARDLRPLADRIGSVSFPNIFRDTKLPPRKSANNNIAKSPNGYLMHATAWTANTTKPSAAKPSPPSVKGTLAATGAVTVKKNGANMPPHTIWVNADGHRLDKPIQNVDRALADRLKQKKLCNKHHLRGGCDGFECKGHSHEGKLNDDETRMLRFVARGIPCTNGIWCEDPDCINGHRCIYGDKCYSDNCRFADDMHGTSWDGAKQVVPNEYITIN